MNKDKDDIRSINYNNHHTKFGLFKFFDIGIFLSNYENRFKFWETPTLPPPSGFSTPITFCKRLVITSDGVLVIVAVQRAPSTI